MKLYNDYLKEYSKGLLGYSAIAIIGQSCLGSIAIMLILMNGHAPIQLIQLFFVTVFCMAYNAMIISQQKAKTSFNSLIISILSSFVFIIINLF